MAKFKMVLSDHPDETVLEADGEDLLRFHVSAIRVEMFANKGPKVILEFEPMLVDLTVDGDHFVLRDRKTDVELKTIRIASTLKNDRDICGCCNVSRGCLYRGRPQETCRLRWAHERRPVILKKENDDDENG